MSIIKKAFPPNIGWFEKILRAAVLAGIAWYSSILLLNVVRALSGSI